jgi:hypothetical protein
LKRLNDALVPGLRQAGIIRERENVSEGQSQYTLATSRQVSKKGLFKTAYYREEIVKHKKVLTGFFAQWESWHGFNQGSQKEGERLPPRPATLTDFVHADDFRAYLLKHAYHWKDAGVGVRHGEFTHRIHWYMVCEKYKDSEGSWLSTKPVELFKTLAEPETINQAIPWSASETRKVSVWDQLVDNGETCVDLNRSGSGNCPHYNKANLFRCPETLHKYIQEQRDTPDLWALGYLIWGRTQKRRNESAEAYRDRTQAYIKKNRRHLDRAGVETGDGRATLGTIIWK